MNTSNSKSVLESDSGILEVLLTWVASDGGVKVIVVAIALVILIKFVAWLFKRSVTLQHEQDQLRQNLKEDGELLRAEVKSLIDELDKKRRIIESKDQELNRLYRREFIYTHTLQQMGVDVTKLGNSGTEDDNKDG